MTLGEILRRFFTFTTKFNFARYCLGGLLMNLSTYFSWLVIPLLLDDRGASPFLVSLSSATTFGLTGLVSPFMGFVSDKTDPALLCRLSFVLQATCSLTIAVVYLETTALWPIYILLLQQSVALACFWSPCESLISNESYKGEENNKLSLFALSWSFGKASGFLVGGPMYVAIGSNKSLLICGALTMIAYVTFPAFPQKNNTKPRPKKQKKSKKTKTETEIEMKSHVSDGTSDSSSEEENKIHFFDKIREMTKPRKEPKRKVFYFLNSLILHFHAYGTAAILCNQYILFTKDRKIILEGVSDDPEVYVSVFLGVLYFAQTFAFLIIGYIEIWQYKMTLNIIYSVILGLVCIAVNYIKIGWVNVFFSIPVGLINGFDLQMNVFYAVKTSEKKKGLLMGVVEMVAEFTCCFSPLIAGAISTETDNLEWSQWTGVIWSIIATVGCSTTQILDCVIPVKQEKEESSEGEAKGEKSDYYDVDFVGKSGITDIEIDEQLLNEIES
ncbi:Major facilitator superfamily (MFS) profile domain-containing protein [Entamoeba marina]